MSSSRHLLSMQFQSTHLIRGATVYCPVSSQALANFNPRTSYEVRQDLQEWFSSTGKISIHAPHTRCDVYTTHHPAWDAKFQSTHLIRGATEMIDRIGLEGMISIHAPHTRCDGIYTLFSKPNGDISIHAPHTRCDPVSMRNIPACRISIHAPHTRCDAWEELPPEKGGISIHAPHTRCDTTGPLQRP